jgi:hypothetical protein
MTVDCARYKDGHRVGEGVMPLEELPDRRAEGGFVWLGLFEPLGRPAGTRQPLSLPDVAGRMFRRGRCAGHHQIQMRFIGRHGQRNRSRARCGLRSTRLPGPCPAAAATVDEQAIDRIRDGIQGCPHDRQGAERFPLLFGVEEHLEHYAPPVRMPRSVADPVGQRRLNKG